MLIIDRSATANYRNGEKTIFHNLLSIIYYLLGNLFTLEPTNLFYLSYISTVHQTASFVLKVKYDYYKHQR